MGDPTTPNPEIVAPPQPPKPVPAPPQHTIFRGPNGIRAGWRALIFLAIFAGIVFLIATALRLIAMAGAHIGGQEAGLTPVGTGVGEGAGFLLAAVAAAIMARIEHRQFGQYGLPLRFALGKNFWIGVLVGFLSISACLLGIFLFHGFHLSGLAIHGSTIASATLAWSLAFLAVGLAEEFIFRGYLQYTLTTGMGFWPAAILLSFFFGLAHAFNPGETKPGLFSVVLFALLFCLFLRRTGNLWLAVGFHMGWDWGQTFFYGVPDSGIAAYHNLLGSSFSGPSWLTGGTVGPEASVFTPIVLAIVGIAFASISRDARYEASEPEFVRMFSELFRAPRS